MIKSQKFFYFKIWNLVTIFDQKTIFWNPFSIKNCNIWISKLKISKFWIKVSDYLIYFWNNHYFSNTFQKMSKDLLISQKSHQLSSEKFSKKEKWKLPPSQKLSWTQIYCGKMFKYKAKNDKMLPFREKKRSIFSQWYKFFHFFTSFSTKGQN